MRRKPPFRAVDGRTVAARRLRDLAKSFGHAVADPDAVVLAHQAAALAWRSEMLRTDLAAGREVDIGGLVALSSELRASLAALQAFRKAR